MSYRITLEGLIGAGKSTFIAKHAARLRVLLAAYDIDLVIVPEPVDEWQRLPDGDGNEHDALEYFYAAPKTRALAFQILVIMTQLAAIERATASTTRRHKHLVVLTERSPESGRHVFVELQRAAGNMSDVEMAMYARCYDEMVARATAVGELSAVLMLDVEPELALERMNARARDGEASSVSADYMKALADAYANALADGGPLHRPTFTIDTTTTTLDALVHFIVAGIGRSSK